jgi:acetyl esterase/lipase/lysophospholipase L1-like esterase
MKIILALFALLLVPFPRLLGADTVIYKRVEGRELKLLIEKPATWKAADQRPAIVFFFGGGWVSGTAEQFRKQSEYLATRGMVGIRVEYRTIPKGEKGPPVVCCADAKSAMRYVRAHAKKLGINPKRIAASGGSAGGHLAAFTALVDGLDDPKDDLKVSCKPDALVLFNPVFNNGPGQWGHERVGDRFLEFSPAHHITKGAPPAIVFLGDQDKLIPVSVLREFESGMKKSGARCDAHVYPMAGHGIFNREPHYTLTLIEADKFLASLGWIHGPPPLSLSNADRATNKSNPPPTTQASATAEPRKTGWPLAEDERAYVLKPEHERRPGLEEKKHLPAMWPVVPSAGHWGGTSWLDTHAKLVDYVKANAGPIDILLVGDSITQQWGSPLDKGTLNESWKKHFANYKTINIGIGGDKAQNVLWRLDHGGVEGLQPKVVIVMIGNNNMFFTAETGIEAAAKGVQMVVANVRDKLPKADVIAVKILPAHAPGNRFYEDIKKTNLALDLLKLDLDAKVQVLDLTGDFLNADGTLKKALFTPDNIHLSPAGYGVYAERLKPLVDKFLKP